MDAPSQVEIDIIRQSGLFLSDWYLAAHPEVAAQGGDGLAHFCTQGWRAGARPNPYFHPHWYLERYPDVAANGGNPLLHYISAGEAEGRDPCPYFFTAWYRRTYELTLETSCLNHFLRRRTLGQVNPLPVFDGAWYLDQNRDVAEGGADPFEHFLAFGVAEERDPSPEFDIKFYLGRYGKYLQGQNPLLHYLANQESGIFLPRRPEQEGLIPAAIRRATRPAPFFEEFSPAPAHAARKARLLAFYLPQFHRVAENDSWWGKGFTDWTNLGRAMPRFVGHVQPRVPRDLGHYSLDDPATLKRQVEMAKAAGLSGFVFYYYWFNRHRLLEKPLEQFLSDPSLDFSFCAMWANENWTRRWDGMEREVLIAQEYLEEDDEALVASFARLFADPRHIRIEGRPLLMIYRANLIPDAVARIRRWRRLFEAHHGERPLLIMAQSLGDDYDPTPYGLDGAVEFPPHKLSQATARINEKLDLLDPDFIATVHDYADLARTSLALPVPDYPLIKTIVPGWDNDPRREGKGLALHNATPALYQDWLEKLISYAADHSFYGEKLICVNAWNEWAEGAFLEPDIHAGAAFLNATARAIVEREAGDLAAGILLVGHDAQAHGAQLLLLHIAGQLKRQWGLKVHLLLLGVGPLLARYYEVAEVTVAYDKTIIGHHLDQYRRLGLRHAIVNSAAAARVVPWAAARNIESVLLIHELPQLLKEYNLEIQARLGGAAAAHLVFSSTFVADKVRAAIGLDGTNEAVLAQGNYQSLRPDPQARAEMRAALGLGARDFLILGAGFAHIRKGFDLFLQLARRLAAKRADVRFIWVGDIEFKLKTYLEPEMAALQAQGRFTHIPFTDKVAGYFAAADVLALTSREDPLPTVVMEALACGVPCVAFDESGGIPELLRAEAAGYVAAAGDLEDYQAGLEGLLDHKALAALRPRLAQMAARRFDFPAYVDRLLALAAPGLKRISAVVLNYNYARHLPERLTSIFEQTYPVQEILLLDDASRDDSLAVARDCATAAGREMRVIANEANSGSVFAQWRKAAQAAQGDYVWLCEADDAAHPSFLAQLAEALARDEDTLLAFTDSRAVDEAGQETMSSYQGYYFQSGERGLAASGSWKAGEFAAKFLSLRNFIPNVSAVLWRREALLRALEAVPDLEGWTLAGDWRLYLELLAGQAGRVAFIATPLNTHRRHQSSVTARLDHAAHLAEIERLHALAAARLQLPPGVLAAQAAYRTQLAGQFARAKKKPAAPVARRKKV
ncbi:glycoside hydrolase family 99-like domain-containing protein [Acidocella facilis]|uniref:glycoside hydrolase family 99-like domain-containing protein n=1 Tax=Acidocella facilis TaxID=525 RepID=UPI0004793C26|nr:glycoside hydrolase family 99-like domain-containing protein [Acidocella facilis]